MMNDFTAKPIRKRIEKVITAMKKNNINGYYVENSEELIEQIKAIAPKGCKVASGGSYSLEQTGALDFIKSDYYDYINRGTTPEERYVSEREAFFSDVYFASANAVTMAGEIYNVDGHGNRVAALTLGPKKVVLVVGYNKIVKDLEAAEYRLKTIASPANTTRLNVEAAGCFHTGECTNCRSDRRICCYYSVTKFCREKDRIHVIFIPEELGF